MANNRVTLLDLAEAAVRKLRVAWLKHRARRLYISYLNIADDYDCGDYLMQHISLRAYKVAVRFDEIMDKLAALGEDVPSVKLRATNR